MYDFLYKIEKKFNKLKEKEIILISLLPGMLLGFLFYQYIYKEKTKLFKKKERTIKVLKSQITDFKNQNMIITSNIQEIQKLNEKIKRYNKNILKFVQKTKNNIYYLKSNNIFKINWVNILYDINKYLEESNIKIKSFLVYLNDNGNIKEQKRYTKKCKGNNCKNILENKNSDYNVNIHNLINSINKNLTNKLLLLKPKYYYYYELNLPNNISDLLLFINKLFNDRKMKQIYLIDFDENKKSIKDGDKEKKKNIPNKKLKILIIYFDIKK